MPLFVDNDSVLELNGLKDQDAAVIANADVSAEIFEADRSTVVTASFTLLPNDTNGDYHALLPSSAQIVLGVEYWIKVSVQVPDGSKGTWWKKERARLRGETAP